MIKLPKFRMIGLPAAIMGGALIGGVTSLIGGSIASEGARKASSMDADLQREFAQHGVSWRVADAKRAGIHPLAALGAQTHSAQASYTSSGDYGMSNAGQSLKSLPLDLAMGRKIQAETAKINKEAELIQTYISQMGQNPNVDAVGVVKPYGYGYQGTAGAGSVGPGYQDVPMPVSIAPGVQKNVVPMEQLASTPGGGLRLVLSQQMSEPLEGSHMDQASYSWTRGKRSFQAFRAYWGSEKGVQRLKKLNEIVARQWPLMDGYKWVVTPDLGGPIFYQVPAQSRGGYVQWDLE